MSPLNRRARLAHSLCPKHRGASLTDFAAALLAVAGWGGFASPSSAAAQVLTQPDYDAVAAAVEPIYPELQTLYQDLHRNPELSLQEKRTSGVLAGELRKSGFEVTEGVGGTGVVAVLKNGAGPTVLLRADMDGLPIKEMTGLPYASQVDYTDEGGFKTGVMHACGHDIHMTCMVGTSRALVAAKDRWAGTVVIIMQPAEERGAGARMMLADGLYTRFPRPEFALALHVDSSIEVGHIGFTSGFAMANVDSVDITVRGIGGHGAYPETTRDPIVIAAEMIMALQTIVSREISALEPAVITVGSIHGGSKHNIIPNEVKMQLTVRSYTDEIREKLLASIKRVANGIAVAAGVPENLMPLIDVRDEYTPATYNDPELVKRVKKVFEAMIGEENVVKREPMMGGEDFSRYGREEPKIPIFLFRLGSVPKEALAGPDPKTGAMPSLHTAFYKPEPEATIKMGVRSMTAAAMELLRPPAAQPAPATAAEPPPAEPVKTETMKEPAPAPAPAPEAKAPPAPETKPEPAPAAPAATAPAAPAAPAPGR